MVSVDLIGANSGLDTRNSRAKIKSKKPKETQQNSVRESRNEQTKSEQCRVNQSTNEFY